MQGPKEQETCMKSDATRKAELIARQTYLMGRLTGIDSELDAHDSKDWEELAVEREDEEVLEDLGQSAQAELRMIEAALQRMDAGEYGHCVTCGERIAEERLDLLPATPFCARHAPGGRRR
jgi:RNA polymerase-binding transcription factor DksA